MIQTILPPLNQAIEVEMDEPSSIIIDTKVTTGNPICSKEQKEKFMKNSLG